MVILRGRVIPVSEVPLYQPCAVIARVRDALDRRIPMEGYSEDPRPHGLCMCRSHTFVPVLSPKGHMALHPPYNRVKAIGAIASHQLWTIGVVALPHTSHSCRVSRLCMQRTVEAGLTRLVVFTGCGAYTSSASSSALLCVAGV